VTGYRLAILMALGAGTQGSDSAKARAMTQLWEPPTYLSRAAWEGPLATWLSVSPEGEAKMGVA
jgi:hypothetical protein